MKVETSKKLVWIIVLFCMILIIFIPFVAGDGMPAIEYGETTGSGESVFSSIFESRQLASVELVNSTHQKISLFLSVYSENPWRRKSLEKYLRSKRPRMR
jgi:hypothetical protein